MSLAASFAEGTACPVMRYLNRAQYLGLVGLWDRLCNGELPERCSKLWFFSCFCGVDAAAFEVRGLSQLGHDADIKTYLSGGVTRPYDVVALMTVLPRTASLFPEAAEREVKGVRHLLLMDPEFAIDGALVEAE